MRTPRLLLRSNRELKAAEEQLRWREREAGRVVELRVQPFTPDPPGPTEATPLATMMITARRGAERQRALAGCSAVAARL
jgi:hypothetical protein